MEDGKGKNEHIKDEAFNDCPAVEEDCDVWEAPGSARLTEPDPEPMAWPLAREFRGGGIRFHLPRSLTVLPPWALDDEDCAPLVFRAVVTYAQVSNCPFLLVG